MARAEIAVWEVGAGSPVLVVHGFPDHPIGMLDLADRISAHGYRCLLPALPGYLPSAPTRDGDYSTAGVGGDLIATLDALGVDRVAYIGHDWGAEIGYPLLAAHPERFSCMIALGTPHPSGYAARRSVFAELRTAWYAMFLAYVPGAAEIARDPKWLTSLVQSWSPGLRWEAWPEIVDRMCEPGVMEAVCAYYRANLDSAPEEPTLHCPTTIIYGASDGCIGPAAYRDFSEFFPAGVNVLELPGVGHWPHLEAPTSTIAAVLERLGSAE
jgi:pimeloyl-ACP methyl ester carboxylesterase